MSKRLVIFIQLLCVFVTAIYAVDLQPCPLKIAGAPKTQVGILVRDLATGEVIADVNSDKVFVPASITKALTVASVLSQLPADNRFHTDVTTDGNLADGCLKGNLIVEACGDPTLESAQFADYAGICDSIASILNRKGISRIEGAIIIDAPVQFEDFVPDGWMTEDLLQTYGAAHHALNFKDNRVVFNATDGTTNPPSIGLKVNRVEGNTIKKPRDDNRLDVGRNARGSRTIANPDPSATFRGVLTSTLSKSGIEIQGKKLPVGDKRTFLYTHISPAFSDIMRNLMFRSDNLFAEGMLRTLAPKRSRSSSCQRELSLWEARGIDTTPIYIEDGSGLSRKNRLSPEFLSDVLKWMYFSPDGPLYTTFFPRAGKEGTMRATMTGTALEGRMATKTGSMRGVQCFAGYILGIDGEPTHTVVVMVNGYTCDKGQLKNAIGKYLIDKLKL